MDSEEIDCKKCIHFIVCEWNEVKTCNQYMSDLTLRAEITESIIKDIDKEKAQAEKQLRIFRKDEQFVNPEVITETEMEICTWAMAIEIIKSINK